MLWGDQALAAERQIHHRLGHIQFFNALRRKQAVVTREQANELSAARHIPNRIELGNVDKKGEIALLMLVTMQFGQSQAFSNFIKDFHHQLVVKKAPKKISHGLKTSRRGHDHHSAHFAS